MADQERRGLQDESGAEDSRWRSARAICGGWPFTYTLIGSSLPRAESGFFGLPLDDELAKRGLPPRCGLFVVDLESGAIEHEVEFSGAVQELYDVSVLPGVRRPRVLGFLKDEIQYLNRIGEVERL